MAHSVYATLSTLVDMTRYWESSPAKNNLWMAWMGLICNQPHYRSALRGMELLNSFPRISRVDGGVLLYTMEKRQINVSYLLYESCSMAPYALEGMLSFLKQYEACTVNMRPMYRAWGDPMVILHCKDYDGSTFPFDAEDQFVACRFVPFRFADDALQLSEDGTRVLCNGSQMPVLETITDVERLRDFVPLRTVTNDRMRYSSTSDDVACWHRFKDGRIAVFCNPFLKVCPAVDSPPPPVGDNVESVLALTPQPRLREIIRLYMKGAAEEDVIPFLSDPSVPHVSRFHVFFLFKAQAGITDALVRVMGSQFRNLSFHEEDQTSVRDDVDDMVAMNLIMSEQTYTPDKIGVLLSAALNRMSDQRAWRLWCAKSPFVRDVVQRVSVQRFARMGKENPAFLCSLTRVAYQSIGTWSRAMWDKVHTLKAVVDEKKRSVNMKDDELHDAVLREYEKQEQELLSSCEHLMEAPDPSASEGKKKGKRGRRKKKKQQQPSSPAAEEEEALEEEAEASPPETHHGSLFCRLQGAHPTLHMRVIGSGLFTDLADLDVVVEVEWAETLQEAYDHVQRETGWEPHYDTVRGDHVVVLAGVFEGVTIDAQVWRGRERADTPAERETERALSLNQRLRVEMDPLRLQAVQDLHAFLLGCQMKGQSEGNLPGVVITCLAIVLTCRDTTYSFERMVRALDSLLSSCVSPFVDFDALHVVVPSDGEPCRQPLVVIAGERNIAGRLTASGTRFLQRLVSHVVRELPEEAWRDASRLRDAVSAVSVLALRAKRKKAGGVVPRVDMDGHPVVVASHTHREEDGTVTVRCILDAENVDVQRYGFRDDDVVQFEHGCPYATVTRRGRRFPIAVPSPVVSDMCSKLSLPNYPYLTADVAKWFPAEEWEYV